MWRGKWRLRRRKRARARGNGSCIRIWIGIRSRGSFHPHNHLLEFSILLDVFSVARSSKLLVPHLKVILLPTLPGDVFLSSLLKASDVPVWLPSISLHSLYQNFSEMPPCQPALGRSENRMYASVTPSRWIQETVQTLHRSIVQ